MFSELVLFSTVLLFCPCCCVQGFKEQTAKQHAVLGYYSVTDCDRKDTLKLVSQTIRVAVLITDWNTDTVHYTRAMAPVPKCVFEAGA